MNDPCTSCGQDRHYPPPTTCRHPDAHTGNPHTARQSIETEIIKRLIAISIDPNQGATRQDAAITYATELDTTMTLTCLRGVIVSLISKLEELGVDVEQGIREWTP